MAHDGPLPGLEHPDGAALEPRGIIDEGPGDLLKFVIAATLGPDQLQGLKGP